LADKVGLHFADALHFPLEALAPPPTLCASNLPYAPAAPFLAEALSRLPAVRRYVVMVQREIAQRIAAPPGSKTYGSLSVWVQLHAAIVEVRPLSRAIFYPRPNVDSSLLTLERHLLAPDVPDLGPVLRRTVEGAFAQRRKSLANALSSALGLGKATVTELLDSQGIPVGARAEQLPPEAFLRLARALKTCACLESPPSRG
jgi:16S rRNA (adenine1518-N6/adenine1519-N6)-dimethyltransferase